VLATVAIVVVGAARVGWASVRPSCEHAVRPIIIASRPTRSARMPAALQNRSALATSLD
jgi:hypothetical protein